MPSPPSPTRSATAVRPPAPVAAESALVERLRDAVGDGGEVAVQPARADLGTGGVDVHLVGVTPLANHRLATRRGLRVELAYVVSVGTTALLEPVLDALIDAPEELDREPVPASHWQAVGVVPRPAVRVRVTTEVGRDLEPAGPPDEVVLEPAGHDGTPWPPVRRVAGAVPDEQD